MLRGPDGMGAVMIEELWWGEVGRDVSESWVLEVVSRLGRSSELKRRKNHL